MSRDAKTTNEEVAGAIPVRAAVKLDGSGNVVVTAAKTDVCFGVLGNRPHGDAESGDKVGIDRCGYVSEVLMDGSGNAISKGDLLMPGAGGKLLKHDGAAGSTIVGEADEDVSTDSYGAAIIFDDKQRAT